MSLIYHAIRIPLHENKQTTPYLLLFWLPLTSGGKTCVLLLQFLFHLLWNATSLINKYAQRCLSQRHGSGEGNTTGEWRGKTRGGMRVTAVADQGIRVTGKITYWEVPNFFQVWHKNMWGHPCGGSWGCAWGLWVL